MKIVQYMVNAAVFWFSLVESTKWSRSTSGVYLAGEWALVDCSVCKGDNLTLWHKLQKVHVDNKKIKMAAKKTFKITNLSSSDKGKYMCKENSQLISCLNHTVHLRRGNAFLKALIIKEPDKRLYDLNDKVKLICTLDKSAARTDFKFYDIKWCDSKGIKVTAGPNKGKIITLDSLTEETVGEYKCEVRRTMENYDDSQVVSIRLKAQFKPRINVLNYKRLFAVNENEHLTLSYNVSSYPASNITWWRSKLGKKYELITRCLASSQNCDLVKYGNKENITKTSFTIKDVRFPEDSFFYRLNARNIMGNDSKTFQIQVLVKPEIDVRKTTDTFKKGMMINCTIKRANPPQPDMNITWYACENVDCAKDDRAWKLKTHDYSLTIDNQAKAEVKYRCIARNVAGEDISPTITIFKQFVNGKSATSVKTMLFVVVPIGVLTITVVAVTCFVLFKRKKLYGGFYIFSYPPLPDYMESLDINGNIQEQLQKLPFLPEWEFPRERISFIRELGSGEFGIVWLAEAMGISAFHPRNILKEIENRRPFFFFNRMAKRNSYVYSKEVTEVAVKRMKGNWDRSRLVDLQSELKILIHAGENDNIVNVLGACTKGIRKFVSFMVFIAKAM